MALICTRELNGSIPVLLDFYGMKVPIGKSARTEGKKKVLK